MSLINDVLRDLERRRQSAPGAGMGGVRPALAPERRRVWWPLLALLPVLGGAGWWAVSQRPVAEPAVAPEIAVTAPVIPAAQPPAQTAELTGLAISQGASRLQASLSLRGSVSHRAVRLDEGRRLRLALDKTRLQAPVPPVTDPEGLLQGLDVQQEGERLLLSFEFAAPSLVQTAVESDGEGSVVRVTVRRAVPAAPLRPPPAPAAPAMAARETAPAPARPEPAAEFQKTPRELSPAQQADLAYAQGLAHERAGRDEEALAAWQRALGLKAGHREARGALVELLLKRGRGAEAEGWLREAHARWPADSGYAQRYARLLVAQGREAQALTVLEAARPAEVGDGEHWALLGALYQRQGRFAESAEAYARVLAVHPQREPWWMGMAISLEGAGQTGPAVQAYRRALALPGLSPELRRYADSRLTALGAVDQSSSRAKTTR